MFKISILYLVLVNPGFFIFIFLLKLLLINYVLYVFIVICLFFYLKLLIFAKTFVNLKIVQSDINIYIHNYWDLYKCYFVMFFFFSYFVIYLKIINILSSKKIECNLHVFFRKIDIFINKYNIYYIWIIIISILVIYIIIYILNYLLFLFSRKFFLKLYFFRLGRLKKIYDVIFFLKKVENYKKKKLGYYYKYFIFFRYYSVKIVFIIWLLINVLMQDGEIGIILKYMPFYGLYYLLINIYNFIISKFQIDFDISIMECYYKNLNFFIEKNILKKNEYIKHLLFDSSEFLFKDSIYYELKNEIEPNFLMLQTYKYTINSSPNDFHSKIKLIKPKPLFKKK